MVVGYICLGLALLFLAAAKGRYTVQPADERGPFRRSLAYGIAGILFAMAALAILPF